MVSVLSSRSSSEDERGKSDGATSEESDMTDRSDLSVRDIYFVSFRFS